MHKVVLQFVFVQRERERENIVENVLDYCDNCFVVAKFCQACFNSILPNEVKETAKIKQASTCKTA